MTPTPAVQRIRGIVLGAIVLGLLAVLAVVLPKLTSEETLELPETLPGGFTAVDVARDGDDAALPQGADPELQGKLFAASAEQLEELYDTPAAVRMYSGENGTQQLRVVAIDATPGPFLPDGPPYDAELVGAERLSSELVKVDGAVCNVLWAQAVTGGAEIPEGDPVFVRCQLSDSEDTWQIEAEGVPAEQAVEVLQDLAG
ncbi:hypothetical protein [Nocardioides sp. zg-DK7169]|uniref:hypothetical protein n=1 Tax=Nocardioides sp. zg-DK7169 TaxID=2736600 RepID=UPI001556C98E|nr:hypothetical protein [Nocardioides sp. zg-DK7169]NPC98544.1 hypothetical protein [Nocardioides sp. zg-DK7169]